MITITDVAADYIRAKSRPITTAEAQAYDEAAIYYRRRASELQSTHKLTITMTDDPDPYPTAEAQAYDLRVHQNFRVSTAYCHHEVFDTYTNVAYRIVHDIVGHGMLPDGPAFTVAGELTAWSHQLNTMQRDNVSDRVINVAFTETVGQLAYAALTGDFPSFQRARLLSTRTTDQIRDDR